VHIHGTTPNSAVERDCGTCRFVFSESVIAAAPHFYVEAVEKLNSEN